MFNPRRLDLDPTLALETLVANVLRKLCLKVRGLISVRIAFSLRLVQSLQRIIATSSYLRKLVDHY